MILIITFNDVYSVSEIGRFSFGSYLSNESFKTGMPRDRSNDHLQAFLRFYLRIFELGENKKSEIVTEVKEKYNFYGKFDYESRKLEPESTLQIRQLAYKITLFKKISMQMGRFPVVDTSHYVDGLRVSKKVTEKIKVSLWGGFNPEEDGIIISKIRSKATQVGTFINYRPESEYGKNKFYTVNGLALQQYESSIDRLYYHHNLLYQWNGSRFFSLINLEFIPRTYLQRGSVSYYQKLKSKLYIDLRFQLFDVIEYRRTQGVREKLVSSPYQELSLKTIWNITSNRLFLFKITHGKRRQDNLERSIISIGMNIPKFLNKHYSFSLNGGYKNDFTNNNYFFEYELSQYSKRWEANFNQRIAYEIDDFGNVLHPLMSGISLSYFFNKIYFATFTYEYTFDQNVKIQTALLNILYRFGSSPTPPLKNGSPPRGKI